MARETLTQEYLKSILDYSPETGVFVWRHRPDCGQCWNTRLAGKQAGCVGWTGKNKARYVLLRINDVLYKAHRIAWIYTHGNCDGPIDHIDGRGTNNKISNLRLVNRSQNQCNRGRQSNNTSGYKGVSWDKNSKKWHSYIKKDRKKHHLGRFNCPTAAYFAYYRATKEYHGEFARVA